MKIIAVVESGTKIFIVNKLKRCSLFWEWYDGFGGCYSYDINSKCIFRKIPPQRRETLAYKNLTKIELDYQE